MIKSPFIIFWLAFANVLLINEAEAVLMIPPGFVDGGDFVVTIPAQPPPFPIFSPSLDNMPLPSLVTSQSTAQFIADNEGSIPEDVKNWLSDNYNDLMVSVGQNDFWYPEWLKQAAIPMSNNIKKTTGNLGLATSTTLLDLTEWALGFINNDVAIALDSAKTADDLIAIALLEKGASPLMAAFDANLLIWGDMVAPQLEQYGKDPIDLNYQEFYSPPSAPLIFSLTPTCDSTLDSTLASLLQSSYRVAEDLHGANRSFDRYTGAYNNGDSQSALLQMEAILYYVDMYKNDAEANASLTETLIDSISLCSSADILQSQFVGLESLAFVQEELLNNGFPSVFSALFSDFNLSPDDILGMQDKILNLTVDDFSEMSIGQGLSQIKYAMSSTVLSPNNVPEPGSLLLVIIGLLSFLISRKNIRN